MTALEIDFHALDAKHAARRDLTASDWRADEDYQLFVAALREAAKADGSISQNDVRVLLFEDTVDGPRCAIQPNRYSAFFNRARKDGLIETAGFDVCTTSPSGNNGKPQKSYAWIGGAA